MTTPTPKISTPTPKVYFDQLTFFLSPEYLSGLIKSATNDREVFEQVKDYLFQLGQINIDLDLFESKKNYLQNLREKSQLEYLKKIFANYLQNELLSKWFMATLDSISLHPESDYINSKEYLPIYNQISKNIDLIKILNKDSYDRGIKRKNAIASHLPAQSEPERDKAINQSEVNDSISAVEVKPAQSEPERDKAIKLSVPKILNRLLEDKNEKLSNEETEYLSKRSVQASISRWYKKHFGRKSEMAIYRMTTTNKSEKMTYNDAFNSVFKDLHPYLIKLADPRIRKLLSKRGYSIDDKGYAIKK